MGRHIVITFCCVLTVVSVSDEAFGWSYNVDASMVVSGDFNSDGIIVSDGYLMWTPWDGRFFGYDLAAGQKFLIDDQYLDPMSLLVDSGYLVWPASDATGLKGYDLHGRQAFAFADPNADFWSMTVADGHAVWQDNIGSLHGYDLAARQAFLIDNTESWMANHSLAAGYFVWRDGDGALHGCDLNRRSAFSITAEWGEYAYLSPGGKYVLYDIWGPMAVPTLCSYDLAAHQSFVISEPVDMWNLAFSDRFVVWSESMNMQLHAFDLQTRTGRVISDQTPMTIWMSPGGDFVAWMDPMNGGLQGYDLSSGTAFVLTEKYVDEMSVGFYGDRIVWMETDLMSLVAFDLASHERYIIYSSWNIEVMERERAWRSARYIGWREYVGDSMQMNGFDLQNRRQFSIPESALDIGPIFHDDYVVWTAWTEESPRLMCGRIYCLANDLCTEAAPVAENTPYQGDTTGATGHDQSSCAYNDWRDVWHIYRPTAGGPVTVSVEAGMFDTTLSIFDACGNDDLACNDDRSLDSTDSSVSLDVVRAKQYLIRVAGFDGQAGGYSLTVTRGRCAEPVRSDLNADCRVNMADLAIFATDWLHCGLQPAEDCATP